jgi:hypothetical protein
MFVGAAAGGLRVVSFSLSLSALFSTCRDVSSLPPPPPIIPLPARSFRCPTTRQKIVSTRKWLYKLSLSFFLSRRRLSQSQGGGRKDALTRSPRMIRETRVSNLSPTENNNNKNHMMMSEESVGSVFTGLNFCFSPSFVFLFVFFSLQISG